MLSILKQVIRFKKQVFYPSYQLFYAGDSAGANLF